MDVTAANTFPSLLDACWYTPDSLLVFFCRSFYLHLWHEACHLHTTEMVHGLDPSAFAAPLAAWGAGGLLLAGFVAAAAAAA